MLYDSAEDEAARRRIEAQLYAPPKGMVQTRRRRTAAEARAMLAAVRAEDAELAR